MGLGRNHGLEMWARWQAMPRWRLDGGLLLQRVRTRVLPGSTDVNNTGLGINDPERQFTLRSSHELADDMQLDFMFRHVGKLPRPAVPAYSELDINWQWNLTPAIDVAITGQNLLHRRHAEWGAATTASQFERTVLFSTTLRF